MGQVICPFKISIQTSDTDPSVSMFHTLLKGYERFLKKDESFGQSQCHANVAKSSYKNGGYGNYYKNRFQDKGNSS